MSARHAGEHDPGPPFADAGTPSAVPAPPEVVIDLDRPSAPAPTAPPDAVIDLDRPSATASAAAPRDVVIDLDRPSAPALAASDAVVDPDRPSAPALAGPDVVIDLDRPSAPALAGPDVVIDLDRPSAPARAAAPREPRRAARVALLAVFALAAAVPQGAPRMLSEGRTVPLPSFCTGTPIPGGRLNIIQGDNFIILDATTNTVVNSGRCPHGTGKLYREPR
ncbi:hypothetical protein [Dactylosporangium sp. CA-139066]|uniref:hypothetical protein n=1 Tax=Dactylosporangium sp. CA-139066 TaxID=3239930 RepID=UPI003D8B85E9